jgi:TolB protein
VAAYPGDNGRIAYVSPRPGGPGTQREIFTIRKDGTGRRRLTNNDVKDDDPVYSPSGRRIAFERAVGATDDELFVMRADGRRVRRITNNDCNDANPTWSPNGRWLAFDSDCPESDGRDVWKIRLSDRHKVQLTDEAGNQIHPAWSVDREIVFEDQDGDVDIWKMDTSGVNQVPLTSGADDDQDPSWSGSGNFIAFERIPDGSFDFELWRMRADGSDEEELSTDATKDDGQPAYAPNNRRIAFARSPDTDIIRTQIFIMAAGGGPGKRVTNESMWAAKPDWQPFS